MWTQTELWRLAQNRRTLHPGKTEASNCHVDDLDADLAQNDATILADTQLIGHPCRRLRRPPGLTEFEPDDAP